MHEILKYLVGTTTLLIWIHHVEESFIILEILHERMPFGFIGYLPTEKFFLDQLSKVYSIHPLF